MRETLTVLAGLLLLALVAALVGPSWVDWDSRRADFDRELSRIAGVEVVTTGPIRVTLLPSPRLEIGGLRAGAADGSASGAVVTRLAAEIALGPLMRGEIRLAEALLDGASITAVADGGLVLPAMDPDRSLRLRGVTLLAVKRSQLTLVDPAGRPLGSWPLAFEARLPEIEGSWRLEGEIAGQSIRIVTGEHDSAGRLRTRASLVAGGLRAEFDGWLRHAAEGGRLAAWPQGQLQLALGAGGEVAATLAAQLSSEGGGFALDEMVFEAPGAARLEGRARWAGPGAVAQLRLQGRRIDAGDWLARWREIETQLATIPAAGLAPPATRIDLAVDQIAWRGEEATDVAATLLWRPAGWRLEAGRLRFADLTATVEPRDQAAPLVSLRTHDLRRFALAIERLGVPADVAQDLASLGDLEASAEIVPASGGLAFRPWLARGRFGEARGEAAIADGRLGVTGVVTGADILNLVRPVAALAHLADREIALDLRGERVTLGGGAPGEGSLQARRRDGRWYVDALEARGFDGVALGARRRDEDGAEHGFSLQAQRADAVSALAERLTSSRHATAVLRALREVSPLSVQGRVARRDGAEPGWDLTFAGQAGALQASGSGALDRERNWREARIDLSSRDRAVVFRALGLPAPAEAHRDASLSARLDGGGLSLDLLGSDGLRANLSGRWSEGGAPRDGLALTLAAPSLSAIAPLWAAGAQGQVTARARLDLSESGLRFSQLEASVGGLGARGGISIGRGGEIAGDLALDMVEPAAFAAWLTGPLRPVAQGFSGERFGPQAGLPEMALRIASRRVVLPGLDAPLDGAFRLDVTGSSLRLHDIALSGPGVAVSGSLEGERQGGLLAARAALEIRGVAADAVLGPGFAGRANVAIQLGASGESMARLVASLTGAGQAAADGLTIRRLDAAGLRALAEPRSADALSEAPQGLLAAVRRAVEAGDWRLSNPTLGLVVSGGVARIAPLVDETDAARLTLVGSHDLRSGQGELRATMVLKDPPRGWTDQPPQVVALWRGGFGRFDQRTYELGALSNALSQRALQREIERVEAFEADIRERAMFNRRLRAEREMRANEERAAAATAAAEARRQAEERARAQAEALRIEQPPDVVPPLPPPLQVNPLPQPFQTPLPRVN